MPETAAERAVADPEIRIDQLTGSRTILAPARSDRPDAFRVEPPAAPPEASASCPFCEGREDRTPPEVWASRPAGGEPDAPGWRQRSVPNLYPALVPAREPPGSAPAGETGLASSIDPLASSARGAGTELFRAQPALGAHEVIVSSPRHARSLAELDREELAGVVEAWRERMRAHAEAGASYLHLIVNEGPAAGASLEHSHAQLYALGFVPALVARERERAVTYHERTMGSNLLGDVLVEEIRRRERVVAVDEETVLLCPWASGSPYELRIVPRRPAPRFEEAAGGAAMIATALRALAGALGAVPQLNLWVRTAPRGAEQLCWHVDVVPRLAIRAGFELGAGVPINVLAPELAAARLRDALA